MSFPRDSSTWDAPELRTTNREIVNVISYGPQIYVSQLGMPQNFEPPRVDTRGLSTMGIVIDIPYGPQLYAPSGENRKQITQLSQSLTSATLSTSSTSSAFSDLTLESQGLSPALD